MSIKSRKLTKGEKKIIEDMVIQKKTDNEIAEYLGRSVNTIQKYRTTVGFVKTGRGKPVFDGNTIQRISKNEKAMSEGEKILEWKKAFKQGTRYKRLADELIFDDLDFFCDQWASYNHQMEDMKPAEEDTLEILITYQIRLRHNRKDYKSLQIAEERYRKELGDLFTVQLDLESEDHRNLWEMIISNNNAKKELNKEFKDLTDKHDNLLKSLNVTREQREQQQKIGADTFLSLIKRLNDKEERAEIGKYNERMKFSTETQIKKLKEDYEFLDGTIEPVYLDGDDYKSKPKIKGEE